MYTFRVLQANSEEDADLLASMHHLRWGIFHKQLRWSVGLRVYNCMEFDEYDTDGTHYIVRVNDRTNKVDATCRLMPTSKPYMLNEHYSHFIENEPVPHTDDVWEFSRTCAHPEAAKSTNGKITAQLIASAVEFGLVKGVKNYISLTTDTLYPMLKRMVGWDPKMLGDKKPTPDDVSYPLKYTVSYDMLLRLRDKNKIESPLLYSFDETLRNPKELWHDNHFIREEREQAPSHIRPEEFSGGGNIRPLIP